MEVQEGKTYLTVPHEGGRLTFQHPPFAGTYGIVAEQIDSQELGRPTSSQISSLVQDTFQNPNGNYESQIIDILREHGLWEFTGNLYLPKGKGDFQNGVILEDNPQVRDRKLVMDTSKLIGKLEANDSSVRFVPFGYKTGEQTPKELGENPYIIARYGEEGAQKIAEVVASKFRFNPVLWALASVNQETASMSALDRDWGFGCGLIVGGDGWVGVGGGRSFGVLDSKSQ